MSGWRSDFFFSFTLKTICHIKKALFKTTVDANVRKSCSKMFMSLFIQRRRSPLQKCHSTQPPLPVASSSSSSSWLFWGRWRTRPVSSPHWAGTCPPPPPLDLDTSHSLLEELRWDSSEKRLGRLEPPLKGKVAATTPLTRAGEGGVPPGAGGRCFFTDPGHGSSLYIIFSFPCTHQFCNKNINAGNAQFRLFFDNALPDNKWTLFVFWAANCNLGLSFYNCS